MKEADTYYETLITRYFSGETSVDEASDLLLWIKDNPDNLNLFMEMRKTWVMQYAHLVDQVTDLDEEWQAIYEAAETPEIAPVKTPRTLSPRFLSGVAAAILLLLVPTLTLIYFLVFMQPTKKTIFAEGQILESRLPDGTQVTLNEGSILYYPSRFKGSKRVVTLEGEAFFDVSHDDEMAFVINASNMKVRVLGTSFYINTHSDSNTMEVALISGQVELNYKDRELLLNPGEKAIVNKRSGNIETQQHIDLNLLAWKTKTLHFNDTPLKKIIEVLENVYNKEILVMNPAINNCRITATFKGQSLEAVLLVLQSTIDVIARPNGNRIEISGTGCQ
jgi:ferric-dicitrate binding protein FerR (iron transport regulator)